MRDLGYLWQSYQLEALKARTWSYRMRIWINNVLYDNNDVFSDFKKDFKMFSDGFTLGNCPSGYFEFAAKDKNTYIPKNSEVRFEIQIVGERGNTEWFPFGTYFIDNRSVEKATIRFQCYDRMMFAEENFWKAYVRITGDTSAPVLRPKMSMTQALSIICQALDTQLDTRSEFISGNAQIDIGPDYTCREVLTFVAMSNAGNFIFTDEDKLRLLILHNDNGGSIESRNDFLILTMSDSPQVLAVNPSNFAQDVDGLFEIVGLKEGSSAFDYPIASAAFEYYDAVQLQTLIMVFEEGSSSEEDDEGNANYYLAGAENGTPSLEITNVFATQEICNNVYNLINQFEYRGFNANTVIMDPAVEIGDPIILEDTFINVINCSWYGILAADLESPLSGNTTSEFPYTPTEARTFSRVVKKIKNVEVKLEVTEESIRASVQDLTDYTDEKVAEFTLTAQGLDGRISQEITNRISGDSSLSNQLTLTAEGLAAQIINETTSRQGDVTRLEGLITTTAEGIRADFEADIEGAYDAAASAEYTANGLVSRVHKSILAAFTRNSMPTKSNTTDEEKAMLCEYNNKKYYYDEYSKSWKVYPYGDLETIFRQTASGFDLVGNVNISGDLITEGTITGTTIRTNPNFAGDNIRLNSNNNCLELMYGSTVIGSWSILDLGISNIAPTGGGILKIGNTNGGSSGGSVQAIGSWNFSSADVYGLSAIAVFG